MREPARTSNKEVVQLRSNVIDNAAQQYKCNLLTIDSVDIKPRGSLAYFVWIDTLGPPVLPLLSDYRRYHEPARCLDDLLKQRGKFALTTTTDETNRTTAKTAYSP